ncbi:protein argonaute MEL1-like [Iris pallida]|uniref:Protein argonaute MEL1-like n=1 Tax=Iris pallida TaxID=29817 RepID=A0AAX6IHF4_IRIPA|nr:protein argonaute MEL1-like [Iris pallida]KAJ6852461.1 protein argonaute MEL1-like [Iris pallida]
MSSSGRPAECYGSSSQQRDQPQPTPTARAYVPTPVVAALAVTHMGLSLNIDMSATSFYEPLQVVDFARQYLNIDLNRALTDRDRISLKKALRGVKVEVTHMGDCRRRYKITGVTSAPLRELTFPIDESGDEMHVTRYFEEKYQFRCRHVSWPCLQAGSDSRPIYLPMEVCKIVEGQRFSKKLNKDQVTAILRATWERPLQRENNSIVSRRASVLDDIQFRS